MGARWVDPALSRWLSADTRVPEADDPQGLNRFSYCLNNPLRYIDPLGLFTDDAIIAYLQSQYGEDWEQYWKQWQLDSAWMDLLHAAQAGDILTMIDENDIYYYQFLGEGVDFLNGVVRSSDVVGSKKENYTLALEPLRYNSLWRGLYRIGVFRMVNNHLISPYHNPTIQVELRTATNFEATTKQVWYALLLGVPSLPLGVRGYIPGTVAGGYGGSAILEKWGGKEGDDELYVDLIVAQGFLHFSAYVRQGSVVSTEFHYASFDEFPECSCCPFCP